MTDSAQTAFESFLVEDVILTLGNLRGSLGWLGERPEQSRAGLDRLDRQLGLLEDRARAVCRQLRAAPDDGRPEAAGDNLFAAILTPADEDVAEAGRPGSEADGISIETAILDALGDGGGYDDAPVFRSRRG
ncbi:MAG: hypothetical protein H5U18_04545 [Rhodobacteraceae bacterium]|nr:hypothetical protein [Paracoccaceae bacterium]